ncbi:hypothetical protein Pr1d_31120 [Bythopirellula goksoeyrii]|uniref:Uncharacterized protein n=1 Tax=Bythopirellula goksoeyrii TaxID=1400387 RepID=A0A5B9QFW2_9BACT|nr:hypothetical protein Pr1d_31120 [Bythopirellula goksoeyrii]
MCLTLNPKLATELKPPTSRTGKTDKILNLKLAGIDFQRIQFGEKNPLKSSIRKVHLLSTIDYRQVTDGSIRRQIQSTSTNVIPYQYSSYSFVGLTFKTGDA